MAKTVDVRVPDIGDFEGVEIIEVLVKAGDEIEAEQSLVTLESDKATMEVPSPQAGRISELKVKEGDSVSEGDVILTLESEDEDDGESGKQGQAEKDSGKKAEPEAERNENREKDKDKGDEKAGTRREEPSSGDRKGAPEKAGSREVKVPDIGDFESVEIIEVLVSAGDEVEPDQSLITLESDKATMEVPSPAAGRVVDVKVGEGDKVSEGDVILLLETGDGQAGKDESEGGQEKKKEKEQEEAPARERGEDDRESARDEDGGPRSPPTPGIPAVGRSVPHASPSVRRYARELGVDLTRLAGSGRKGRILREDVQGFVKQVLSRGAVPAEGVLQVAPSPDDDFEKYGDIEVQPLSRIRKISGPLLHRNWVTIPHVTQHEEADITELEAFRKEKKEDAERQDVKLTMVSFLLKASAVALREFPEFNASLDKSGEKLILKKYYHIGFAVDTKGGLIVPVIRDVDQKGIFDIARELAELSQKARDGKLSPSEMKGGCFSISSLGGIGGTGFTPIVNAPEVAILGVSRARMQPVWDGQKFEPRLMLPLSLSYDHRVIDGAAAARFAAYLADVLSDIRDLLL